MSFSRSNKNWSPRGGFSVEEALKKFQELNRLKIKIVYPDGVKISRVRIITDSTPNELKYPNGWYYAKGTFRNKHLTTDGSYTEIGIYRRDGNSWGDFAKYCFPEIPSDI